MKASNTVMLSVLTGAMCIGVAIVQLSARQRQNTSGAGVASWSQYGFAANHSSYNNLERTLTGGNTLKLTLRWSGDVGASQAGAPVVGNGLIYAVAGGTVFAFQASDGAMIWSRLSCSGSRTVEAALGSQALFVGDSGGDLAAYDPATGDQLWCRDEGGSITAAPAADSTTVYATNGSTVFAADQSTGNTRWVFTPADNSSLTNTPAILNGVVYVTGGSSAFALSGTTGHLLWRTNLPSQANISAPAVAGGLVYVGGQNLYALRASDGGILWTETQAGVNVSMPAIANGRVFVNSQDPLFGLYAFDAMSGALLWQNRAAGESSATPTVANSVVFDIADSGGLMMFNMKSGVLLGTINDPGGHPFNALFGSQAAVVNGTVYLPTADFFGANSVDALALH